MKKIEFEISENDLNIIKNEIKKGSTNQIRNKALTLYMRSQGKTEKEIKEKTGLAVSTFIEYIKNYIKLGINSLYITGHKGQRSQLNNYTDIILEDFEKKPPSSIDEAIVRIEKLTDIKLSKTTITMFLKKTVFLTKKQEAFQQKANKEEQQNFIK